METPRPGFEWVITRKCNYACPYCTPEKKKGALHGSDGTVDAVLGFVSSLQESWLVKLIGGEPFLHPRFFEICTGIVKNGHALCLSTNFSVPLEALQRLVDICGDKLEYLHASFHESQVKDVSRFIEKAVRFKETKRKGTRFIVTAVLLEDDFERLKKIEEKFKESGVNFKFQIRKEKGRYHTYTEEIEAYLSGRLSKNIEKIRGKDFFGTLCHTGRLFFVIQADGNAVRCYNPHPVYYRMGNVADGSFRRLVKTMPCLSRKCSCTVPANRGMIWHGHRAGVLTMVKARLLARLEKYARERDRRKKGHAA
jgi:MoaA/NifB/PqqE/SkfB family radical SAM enzyme